MNVLRAFVGGTPLLTALHPEQSVLVGSGAECDLRLETAGMPARAAVVRDLRGVLWLVPLSEAALQVDGRTVTSLAGVALHRGSHITIGGVTVAVRHVVDADALKARRAWAQLEIARPRTTVTAAAPTAAKAALPEIEFGDDGLFVVAGRDATEDSGVHAIYDEAPKTAERVAG